MSTAKGIGQYDLFGNVQVSHQKSFDEEYKDYLSSAQWKRIREAKIDSVNGKCERCQTTKWSAKLTVHHRHYDTFKKERLDDLEALCIQCHQVADTERINAQESGKGKKALYRGFAEWMDKGNNARWRTYSDEILYSSWTTFLNIISQRTGKHYQAPFWRDPEWK